MANNKKPFDTIKASNIALSNIQTGPEARAGAETETAPKNHTHAQDQFKADKSGVNKSGVNKADIVSPGPNALKKFFGYLQSRPQLIFYSIAIICLLLASLAFVTQQNHRRALESGEAPDATLASVSPEKAQDLNQGALGQAQSSAQRRQAQDLLAEILQQQKKLTALQVALWAETDYLAAQAKTEQGDKYYQGGQFDQAIQTYQLSLDLLRDIASRLEPFISETLASSLTVINKAKNQPDIDKARISIELILAIQPNHKAAQQAFQRLEQLPQVLELLATAESKFNHGEFATALVSYQQALKLDPLHPRALTGVEQSKTKITDAGFQAALNQGFRHLEQSSYAAASQAFKRALSIRPASDVAAQALLQAQTELNQVEITRLLSQAEELEKQERWSQALRVYEEVLTIDSSVVSATVGRVRSQTRDNLDADLKRMIEQPLRLASSGVYKQAEQLLGDARGIQPAGPGRDQALAEQIVQLEEIMALATTPQTITLASDNATLVTILRVGKLGQFNEKTIKLKPGKYVAEGIRQGYRDIRINFTVDGSDPAPAIQIACVEAI